MFLRLQTEDGNLIYRNIFSGENADLIAWSYVTQEHLEFQTFFQ